MVIRGKTRGNGKQLANYLMSKGENENVRVLDIRGTSQPDNIHKSLLEMSLSSELSKSDKGLYHAQLNPGYGDDKTMTYDHWLRSADIVEKELKLEGQKRVIVLHEKNNRIHAHVVWERFDHDKNKMKSDSYTHYAQDRARQTIEKELGHKRTPLRNVRRPEMKAELTKLWKQHDNPKDFIKAAEEKGYFIGVSRQSHPYRVVDATGRGFNLVKQIDGVKQKDVRAFFKDHKLQTDRQAIVQARSATTEKNLNAKQEQFIDRVAEAREQRAAKNERRAKERALKAEFAKDNEKMAAANLNKDNERFSRKIDDYKDQRKTQEGAQPYKQETSVKFDVKEENTTNQQQQNAGDITDNSVSPETKNRRQMQSENKEDIQNKSRDSSDGTGQVKQNSRDVSRKKKDEEMSME